MSAVNLLLVSVHHVYVLVCSKCCSLIHPLTDIQGFVLGLEIIQFLSGAKSFSLAGLNPFLFILVFALFVVQKLMQSRPHPQFTQLEELIKLQMVL
ncbi:hypothetical protein XELAEV_18031865mg [Xenopus laevis]|uniref:Uncharacterized protein n=1 Tax=Xenopus laevis TaxID=8355 RepID=A0A974CNB4_XENLA|nr:hypothetical protein XELAEV_18031865mg [Xenopus laevis]